MHILNKKITKPLCKTLAKVALIYGCGLLVSEAHQVTSHTLDKPINFENLKTISLSFGLTNIGIITMLATSANLAYKLKGIVVREKE